MITSLMLFLVVVSLFAVPAAWLVERGLRGLGIGSRFTWLGALGLGPAMGLLGRLPWSVQPDGVGGGGVGLAVVELPGFTTGPVVGGGVPDALVGAFWAASILVFAGILLRSRALLGRESRGWRPDRVLGRSVWIGAGTGPAVAGMWRPRIVLPEWVLGLSEPHLALVLRHEEEHVRAGDPRLLAAALVLVGCTPWNPASWWALHRLRHAIEVDCDRRVLREETNARAYGETLLAVAGRVRRTPLALAAFTEPPHTLERRIRAMTDRISARTRARGAVWFAAGVLLAAQACGIDSPVSQSSAEQGVPTVSRIPAELASPTFTPFTVAPEITNRDEVIAALERSYPPLLRDAGVEGAARVYFLILDDGTVADVRLDQSTGHAALDQAALTVARVYRFNPALNRDEPVPVWVSFPITFRLS